MAAFNYFSIAETLEKFRRKEISPVEVITAHLQRAQALQPKLNAFVHLDAESALARARQAEAAMQRGEPLQALTGIPLTVKSCIDVAGWPCPAGSLLRKDYVPASDATLVARLESAGAILLGNTNTPEFLMAYETDNRVSGRTSNPWDLSRSAGGSSGGEAAAIASGCSMGGVGSDGGGSVRAPAHFSGICGLKPTPGRIPATGHFPPGAGAFSWIGVVGPMARTAADLRVLFGVMAGPDASDALSALVSLRPIRAEELRALRIGILESGALCAPTAETQAAVHRAGQLLTEQGFHVEPMKLEGLGRALELWWFFFGPVIGDLIRHSTKGQEESLSPMLREYLAFTAAEPAVTLESFMAACTERDLVRADLLRQLRDVPILLSPVSTAPAFKHGAGNYRAGDAHNYRDTMRYCQWLNLAGFPGLSLPFGQSPEGLPINIQLIARPYEEELLLAVAETLEQSRGPWQKPPQI
ncbi:MAG: amidase [Candidatus Acidiferrum sp.]|jgi:Asp-tRNA(Asn)/Glu-tRNA(Gln) amidotransferase A subunit family amidase